MNEPTRREWQFTPKEREAFKKLWMHGVSIPDMRRVLPKLKDVSEIRIRRRAASVYQLPMYREHEQRPDNGQVDEDLLKQLLKAPRRV